MEVAYSNLIATESTDNIFFKTKVHMQGIAHSKISIFTLFQTFIGGMALHISFTMNTEP